MAYERSYPKNALMTVVPVDYWFGAKSVTKEIASSCTLASILGTIPENACGIDIYSANTLYIRFDGRPVTTSNAKLIANTVYRFAGYKKLLDKIRVAVENEPPAGESESSMSGTGHDISVILYCTDEIDEWESSGSSESSSSVILSRSSASSASSASTSSSSSTDWSDSSKSSHSSASGDDDFYANNEF